MSDEDKLYCPDCGSEEVAATTSQRFMVNTGEHYCFSVKTQDADSPTLCISCGWCGELQHLVHD